MGWIGCVHCEKTRRHFVARTFALIAPVWLVLQQVLRNSETVPNAPKWKETHQTLSLGSNGVDRGCLLRKILTRHRDTNFCIYCFNLYRFASSFVEYRNGSKCTQTWRNTPKHEFRVQWHGSVAFVVKNSNKTSWHELLHQLHQFGAFCSKYRVVGKRPQMHPNRKKRTKTWD